MPGPAQAGRDTVAKAIRNSEADVDVTIGDSPVYVQVTLANEDDRGLVIEALEAELAHEALEPTAPPPSTLFDSVEGD